MTNKLTKGQGARNPFLVPGFLLLALALTSAVVLCSLILPTRASSLFDDRDQLAAFMSELVTQQLADHHIVGATLSIVKDGEVFVAEGYGHSDVNRRTPVNGEQSLFRIGSVSKLVTWTAVMQLVEQGKLDLDADVNRYIDFVIPARLHTDQRAQPEAITMRHLLTHTPGFEDVGEGLFALSAEAMRPLGELLADYLPARVYPAGEVMAYSNYGSALAGYIVERVSGQPFAAYVDEHIFRPLGMDHSTFRQPLPRELAPRLVGGYNYANEQYHQGGFEYIPMYPAGSMSSTAKDMAHFMLAHLQQGRFDEQQVLHADTMQEMHRQQFTQHPQVPGITYGFIEQEVNGYRLLTHNGATMLFFSQLFLLPEHNLGVFVAYNGGGVMQAMDLFQNFMDRYFPRENGTELPQPSADARARANDFLGEYHPTRMSFTTGDRFIGLLQATSVDIDEHGYLLVNVLGEPQQFVEVDAGLYQNRESGTGLADTLAFVTGPDERPLLVMGAATFSKAPWYGTVSFIGAVFAASLLLTVATLFGWLFASLWRLLKRNRHRRRLRSRFSPAAKVARLAAVVFSLVTLGFLLGMLAIFSDIDPAYGVPNIIFGVIPPGLHIVFLFPWILVPLSGGMVLFTVLAWKNGYWTFGGRLHYSLFTASSCALVWVLASLNMIW